MSSPAYIKQEIKRFIIDQALPISSIENEHLQHICRGLPDRQAFTREITDFARQARDLLKAKLAQCSFLSIQFDGWSAHHGGGRFIGVMCTGLCDDNFFEANLGTIPVDEERCDAKYIAHKIEELLELFDIEPRYCATDTEPLEPAALKKLNKHRRNAGKAELKWFPCICHIINLAMKEFAKLGRELLHPIKALENSLARDSSFTVFLRGEGSARHTIAQSTEVRWESTSETVCSILDLQQEILQYLKKPGANADAQIAIQRCSELQPILDLFQETLHVFEADDLGTISYVHWDLKALANDLDQKVTGIWQDAAKGAAAKIRDLLVKHVKAMQPDCQIAARLNPYLIHTKVFETLEEVQGVDEVIRSRLASEAGTADPPSAADSQSSQTRRAPGLFSSRSEARFGSSPAPGAPSPPSDQFEAYLMQGQISPQRGGDISEPGRLIAYWLDKRQEWPDLARFALDILSRPASSAATERHFSLTGRIATLRRIRTLPSHLDDIAFLMANAEISEPVIK
jgi:hypothetical protein